MSIYLFYKKRLFIYVGFLRYRFCASHYRPDREIEEGSPGLRFSLAVTAYRHVSGKTPLSFLHSPFDSSPFNPNTIDLASPTRFRVFFIIPRNFHNSHVQLISL